MIGPITPNLTVERIAHFKEHGVVGMINDEWDALLNLAAEMLTLKAERARIDHILFGDGDRNRGVSFPVSMEDLEKMLLDKLRTNR